MSHEPLQLAGPNDRPPATFCYWVVAGRLLAGTYPGDLDRQAMQAKIGALTGAGVSAFVNLIEANESNRNGTPFVAYDDVARQCRADAVCVRHSIPDQGVPSIGAMRDTLDTIDRFLAEGHCVYVHCWGGVGRTGTVVACWLLRHKLAEPAGVLAALARLRQQDQERAWRRSPENDLQDAFVLAWAE